MPNRKNITPFLLKDVQSPEDIKGFFNEQLLQLADEIRSFILDVVSVHPGHLGASLGVVELTIALHYVFNTPYDKIIWDVGHQAYSHKILTGRRKNFNTLRQWNGISGFPNPDESVYDAFVTGHASTSLSAVLGMAKASALKGETNRNHIVVIGDGGLTGGMTFEAFNNMADANVLIVLNDNGIAIDKNTGIVGKYLKEITSGKKVNLFEAMGIRYFGPVDGHNIPLLVENFQKLKLIDGPKLLHVITTKGKGFKKAEQNQTTFHAPGQFDRSTGEILTHENDFNTYPEVFGETLVGLAEKDEKVVVVTPAMVTGSALRQFQIMFPDRIFDVGIAEQHAVTFAAGLAASGLKPYCVVYSTFLQRAYDQIIHDVALQKLPVVFAIDRAGLVGEDGATHQGVFDMAFLRSVPNMVVAAPMDELELRNLMFTASGYTKGPFAIRYSKNRGTIIKWRQKLEKVSVGKGRKLKEGNKVAVVTIGYAGILAQQALKELEKKKIYVGHFDMRFLKPLDKELLFEIFSKYEQIITIEDGATIGGLGDAVLAFKENNNYSNPVITLGVPDKFIAHGSRQRLYEICGYGSKNIFHIIEKRFLKKDL